MANLFEGVDAREGLLVRIKAVPFGALCTWFVVQIALGHAHIGGAEDTFAGAGIGLGQHCDHGNTGLTACRFHLQVGA
jgi:hypothetical protein